MKMDEFTKMENFLGSARKLVGSMAQIDKMVELIEKFPDHTILEIRRKPHFPDDCITECIEPIEIEQIVFDQPFIFSDEMKSDFISLLKKHRYNLEQNFNKMQLSQFDEYADE